jgi:hypothetical protein
MALERLQRRSRHRVPEPNRVVVRCRRHHLSIALVTLVVPNEFTIVAIYLVLEPPLIAVKWLETYRLFGTHS